MPMSSYQRIVRQKSSTDEAEQRTTKSPEHKRVLSNGGELNLAKIAEPTKRRKITEDPHQAELLIKKNDKKSETAEEKDTINGKFRALSSSPTDTKKVDPTELASAFALASLASLSPGGSVEGSPPRESREAIVDGKDKEKSDAEEVRKAASFESETRSPKASEHPISPEQRTSREKEESDAIVTRSPTSGRRVSFAPNTKAPDDKAPSTPKSSKKKTISPTSSPRRVLAMPQTSHGAGSRNSGMMMMQMSPRPHRMYGGRGLPPFVRTPPQAHSQLPSHRLGYGTPPPPPHAPYHHPGAAASAHGLPPRGGPVPPGSFRHGPPSLHHSPHQSQYSPYPPMGSAPPPSRYHPSQGPQRMPPRQLLQPPLMHRTHSSGMGPPESPPKGSSSGNNNQWICDYCNVASFSSYEEACAHEEICKKAGPAAAAAALMSVSRSYSNVSAASMDEDSVVSMPPPHMMMGGPHPPSPHHPQFQHHGFGGGGMTLVRNPHHASMALKLGHQQHRMLEAANGKASLNKPGKPELAKKKSREEQKPMTEEQRARQELHLHSLGGYIVYPEDMEMIPPYVHFLMRQVEPCLFTEADRFVARSKGPVGYPGFQCRHCHGHAGLGKYFPVSSKSLSTNSTSQNIHAHLLKCRKCPQDIKDQLVQLKIEKSRAARLEPGWRKVFFDKVWQRLHGEAAEEHNKTD